MEKVLDILPVGYLVVAADDRILAANKFMLNLLQMQECELVPAGRLRDLLPVGTRMYFETHVRPLLQMQGMVEEISMELIRKDRLSVPVLMNAVTATNEHDSTGSVQYTFFDVSHRKKYEVELLLANQKQEELIAELGGLNRKYLEIAQELAHKRDVYKKQAAIYRQISEVGRVGGWELDLVAGTLHWSHVTRQIHGVAEDFEPDVATAIGFYKEGENRDLVQKALENAFSEGRPAEMEAQLVTAGGREIWVKVRMQAERSNDKNIRLAEKFQYLLPAGTTGDITVRLYGTFQDIDREKKIAAATATNQRANTKGRGLLQIHN